MIQGLVAGVDVLSILNCVQEMVAGRGSWGCWKLVFPAPSMSPPLRVKDNVRVLESLSRLVTITTVFDLLPLRYSTPWPLPSWNS